MREFLQPISEGRTLDQAEAEQAMHRLMRGEAWPEEIAAFLLGLRSRGETLDELVGFTKTMRQYAVPVQLDDPHAIDLCGTGGDHRGTFNVSTTVAFVCAGAGVTVAKHGNRSVSSKCGSAEVLAALGVNTELRKEGVEQCLKEAGIAFIFAPYFHPAMKHVMPIRRKLGVRTFFNILGPLCNPAGVRRQLIGAFSDDVARQMAQILHRLDAAHVITAHADDGLDELTTTTGTRTYHARQGADGVETVHVDPSDFGLSKVPAAALHGGSAEENATITRSVLDGEPGAPRDVVLLNAAYALVTSGKFEDVHAAFDAAVESIDSGAARQKLEALVEASNAVSSA